MLAGALSVAGLWKPDVDEAGRPSSTLVIPEDCHRKATGDVKTTRTFSRMSQFCMVSFGRGWFLEPMDFYDLVAARLSEPCSKHVPRGLLNSMVFAEQASEIPEEHRLSKNPGIRNFLREVESASGWKTGKVVKKAQPYSVVMILALEDLVMRSSAPAYTRWYAWIKLLKIWGALRWSDVQGVPNGMLRLRMDRVLEGKITRSKTSGQAGGGALLLCVAGGLCALRRFAGDGLGAQHDHVSEGGHARPGLPSAEAHARLVGLSARPGEISRCSDNEQGSADGASGGCHLGW